MARTGSNARIAAFGTYSGAPTFAADLTDLSNTAASLIGETVATVAALPASGNWTGRTITVTADGLQRVWLGSWVVPGEAAADVATFASGVTALTGPHKPRLCQNGNQLFLYGAVTFASPAVSTNLLTIPAAFQPPSTNTRFIGANISSSGIGYMLGLSAGVVGLVAYNTGSIGYGITLPIVGSWRRD